MELHEPWRMRSATCGSSSSTPGGVFAPAPTAGVASAAFRRRRPVIVRGELNNIEQRLLESDSPTVLWRVRDTDP
ncbi:MAG: hypothetical protein ABSH51_13855 [Solirubrobacteraceae bacterium]|jgi:hypothetical protein